MTIADLQQACFYPSPCADGHRWIWASGYAQTEPEPNARCECGAFQWRDVCDGLIRPTGTAAPWHIRFWQPYGR
jgi:hypothetical protein